MTPAERQTLAGLADVLVPAAGRMPSGSQAGVHERWLDRVLSARPDLAEPLTRLVRAADGRDPLGEIERLDRDDGDGVE